MQPLPAAPPGRSFAGNPSAGRSPARTRQEGGLLLVLGRRAAAGFKGCFASDSDESDHAGQGRWQVAAAGVRPARGRQKSPRPRGRPGPTSRSSRANLKPAQAGACSMLRVPVLVSDRVPCHCSTLQVTGRPYMPPAAAASAIRAERERPPGRARFRDRTSEPAGTVGSSH
jgi:hypothetical protein